MHSQSMMQVQYQRHCTFIYVYASIIYVIYFIESFRKNCLQKTTLIPEFVYILQLNLWRIGPNKHTECALGLFFLDSLLAGIKSIANFATPFESRIEKFRMYAIVNIQGQQFKVSKDQQLFVHRLPNAEGESVSTSEVLLTDADGAVTVGAPTVSGASVSFKVLSHLKGDKVIVFKKKRRKGYQKLNGHRQQFSKIQIESITH